MLNLNRPAEALAFLDRARKLKPRRLASHGLSTTAVLRADRAAALVALQKPTLAVADARAALRSSPWLVEARETLATALLCANRASEALCEFRAAMKRPLEPGEERLACVGVRKTPTDADMGDLSTGKDGVFPPIGYQAADKGGELPAVPVMDAALSTKSNARTARAQALAPLHMRFFATKEPAEVLRTTDLRNAINRLATAPATTAALAHAQALQAQIDALAQDDLAKTTEAEIQCMGSVDPNCVRSKCRPVVLQNHAVFMNRQTQLEASMRGLWKSTHRRMDALRQNIGNPVENELAGIDIDTIGDGWWAAIIDGARPMAATETSLKPLCLTPIVEAPADDVAAPDTQKPNPCPPALEKLSVGGDLGKGLIEEALPGEKVGFGWSINCSEVEVSGSWSPLPLLSGFGKLSQSFRDGSATLVLGSKGKGPFGLEFTSEVHITVSRDGAIQDAGWRVARKGRSARATSSTSEFVNSVHHLGAADLRRR